MQGNPVSYVDPFGLSPISNFFSGTAATHLLLGALGMIPGIGFVFDIADAKLYESEGRDEEAALSYFCAAAGAAGNAFRFVGWFTKAGSAANAATRVGERLANLAVHSAMAGSYVSGAGEALSRINAIKRANPDAGIMDYADEWTDLWLNVAGAVLGTSLSVKDVRAVRNAGKELDFAIGELKAAGAAKGTQNLIMDSSARFFSEDVGCCFVEGTMVSTIGGGVAIEDISAGDLVLAGDPVTGDVAYRKVLEIYRKDADTLVHIILENGEEIVTTLTHPFYVDGSGWIPAGSLDTSDRLLAADGTDIRIKDIRVENLEETVTVYNFQVEDYHTYFVGDTQILVHNTCSAGDVAGTIGEQGSTNSKKYYHVTNEEAAKAIMESGQLGKKGNAWESRVFAWTEQPTKRQADIAGIGKDYNVVIEFETKASFEPDIGNRGKSIADIVVQTTDGQRVPITINNIKSVGFKKEWWQFWKK